MCLFCFSVLSLPLSLLSPQVWRNTECLISDLRGLKYAYLGQVAYQHDVIAVAVERILVEQFDIRTLSALYFCITSPLRTPELDVCVPFLRKLDLCL